VRTAPPLARRAIGAAFALLLLVLAAPAALGADEKPAAPAPGAEAEPAAEPAAIPAAEVPTRWQETHATLSSIQQRTEARKARLETHSDLDEIEKKLRPEAQQATDRLDGPITPDALVEIESNWKGRADRYDTWNQELAERIDALSRDLAALETLEGPWQKTSEAAPGTLAKPIVESIDSTLHEIHKTRRLVSERQNAVLVQQDRLAKLLQEVAAVLAQVKSVRRSHQKNLLVVDSVPLWTALSREQLTDDNFKDIGLPISDAARQAGAFFSLQRERVAFFALIILATIAAVTGLRRKAVVWVGEDASLAPIIDSLSRPVSGGFLAAAVSFPWLFPERPDVFSGLIALLVIPPLIYFLVPLVKPSVRRALYALAAWLVVNLFRIYLIPDPFLSRLTLLAEGLVALSVMLWMLRPQRLHDLEENTGALLWLLSLGMRLAILILVGAIIANVVGNVTLAALLTQALVNSLFTAAVLGAALKVIEFILVAALHTNTARQLRMVRRRGRVIRDGGIRFLRIGLVLFWFWISLRRFQVSDLALEYTTAILDAPIGAGDFSLTLGHLFGAILVIVVSVYLARVVRFVLDEDVMPRTNLPRGVPYTISVLAGYGIILLGSLAAVAAAGIDMSRFALVLSALSVGIGIGLQGVVNNFVSGLILLFERPLKVGDTVEVADVRGEVRLIGLRSTTVRTWDGSEVVIPNARFISEEFTNWTLSDRIRRIQIPIGVAYGSPPERVMEILKGIAESNERVMEHPEPRAMMLGFGESSLDFELRAWTEYIDDWTGVRSELAIAIDAELAAAGIQIPFPQRDLHVKGDDASG